MAIESAARKITEMSAPAYRAAPHNIEAEQALLGAVLVNNEALYRVSDFLDPQRQACLPSHAQDISAGGPRHCRIDARPISRPPRSRGDDHHQRGRLWTH